MIKKSIPPCNNIAIVESTPNNIRSSTDPPNTNINTETLIFIPFQAIYPAAMMYSPAHARAFYPLTLIPLPVYFSLLLCSFLLMEDKYLRKQHKETYKYKTDHIYLICIHY